MLKVIHRLLICLLVKIRPEYNNNISAKFLLTFDEYFDKLVGFFAYQSKTLTS